MDGTVKVGYNITFNYEGMRHVDLMIAFAFSWYFYLVLFIIVGVLSVMIMIVFLIYHRLVARGDRIAKFKFWSYFKLTIPQAASGIIIALLPILIINIIIAVGIIGNFLFINTAIFPCDENESKCLITLFDFVKDNPQKVNIDYFNLRTGRCGVAFIIVGAFFMLFSLIVLIPDKSD